MSWEEEKAEIVAARPERVVVLKDSAAYQRERMLDETNFKRNMLSVAKHRAKRQGREFDLKFEEVEFPTHCPVFGHKFVYSSGGDRRSSPSLDRIDSSRGYTADNVQIISSLANYMKRDATKKQLKKFAKWIKKSMKK